MYRLAHRVRSTGTVTLPKIFPILVKKVISGGGGPNPNDAFSMAFTLPDTNPILVDASSFALVFPEANAVTSDAVSIALTLEEVNPAPVDSFRAQLGFSESNTVQNDAATFLAQLTAIETSTAFTEAVLMGVSGYNDTNPVLNDDRRASLNYNQGANANTLTGPTTWVDPANAQGVKDGMLATLTDGSALAAADGTITLTYADPDAAVQAFAISLVEVHSYTKHAPGTVATQISIEYSFDGTTWVSILAETTAVHDTLTTPRITALTAAVAGDWSRITGFMVRVRLAGSALSSGTGSIDAIELRATATKNPL